MRLHNHDQLLPKSDQVIVPESLKRETVNKIHKSHQEVVKSEQSARGIQFWSGMNSQVQDAIEKCSIYAKSRTDNTKEPLLPHKISRCLRSKVGVDLFTVQVDEYILINSEYTKVTELRGQTSFAIINELKSMFSRYGIPAILISDNASQMASAEF